MRIKFTRLIAFVVVFANVIVIYYSLRLFVSFGGFQAYTPPTIKTVTKPATKHISKLVTIIIREFESFENDVSATVQSFLNVFPNIQVIIVYDSIPYPALDISSRNSSVKNVKGVNLSPSLKVPFIERYPVLSIKTKYVLFVPDSTRINSRQILQSMVSELTKQPDGIVVAPVSSKKELGCLRVNVNIREWTLKYSLIKGNVCDAVSGKHLALMETELLKQLPDPFLLPFPHSLYVQTSPLFVKSHHAQWKQKQVDNERLKHLYKLFQLKEVVRETGTTEWYGCTRDTPRCFGPILDLMPSYLFEGKWTPPCCLSNLRKTAKHVFNSLDEAGIRYWLEAGSLLGAMRSGDILPWDHDVDIGFNRDDLLRSQWLKKAKDKPVVDSKGFLWEKATGGNFYRVNYSKTNKIYVNLFPFYSKNGTMTKDAWFTSHKNMEFPDNFLHPMSSIEFVGRQVPSPNNIRDFLELKFGRGAIESPEYPNPSRLPFP
ncbi:LicD domain containing protein [Asbolus verrucosus]|uniref:LicD domain containing protein n=1 Tax=Asbolus verrucosus TaxID=1661398 RepID=A0A482WBN8_ASBVE|nr:LicD domain containing protein [Asbolus verrucosus]